MPEPAASSLPEEAAKFALALTQTTRAVVGEDCEPFDVIGVADGSEDARLRVHQRDDTGVVLTVGGDAMLRLKVEMLLTWDHKGAYLAVDKSDFHVFACAYPREPLFRFEYLRSPTSGVPAAHIQVHAHRDTTTYLMARSGSGRQRSKQRGKQVYSGEAIPHVADLHFPVGGARFRPCLEDVLQMLIEEFGVDCGPKGRAAIAAGRLQWRQAQLGATVRDDPATALRVLREMGFEVSPEVPTGAGSSTDRRIAY